MPFFNSESVKDSSGILQALLPGANIQKNNQRVLVTAGTTDEVLVFNVGGTCFETYSSTLRRLPHTRLSDEQFLKRHYRKKQADYFFDHDPDVFKVVLQYLRTGELHLPSSLCGASIKAELEFWGVEECTIEDCCWLNYNSWAQTLQSLKKLEHDRQISMGTHLYNSENTRKWYRFQNQAWEFLNNPQWSFSSKIYGVVSIILVFASIFSFVSQTHEYFQVSSEHNESLSAENASSYSYLPLSNSSIHPALFIIDAVCFAFFLLEILARFIVCPNKLRFLKTPMNIIDFLALVPDVVSYSCHLAAPELVTFVSLMRIIRVLRSFRLMRHFPGLWTLGYTLKASINELLLMLLFLIIGMLVFSSLIYYAEDRENFPSIPRAFWWALITMTTVGYGDMYPVSNLGYLIGSMTAVSGLLLIGFIVPVLVNNFILYYNHTQCALEREKRRGQRLHQQKRRQKLERMNYFKTENLNEEH
ncbi:hypothetical protein SNE40_021876 [Patella caerulea]|uniref:BTB domain-containing protein n=1 Tax=Patella caerulea TaxID=87958 RepID=A0AAN8J0R9_PATCE